MTTSNKALARAWSAYLELLLDTKLSDGYPVLLYILNSDPDLRRRFREALGID